jgi:exodeoxyribonuclease-3
MKIISWNVNGIRAVWKKGFGDWLTKADPDILCLQETKIQNEQLTEEMKCVSSYYSWFSFAEKKGYSGVAIYSKSKPMSVSYGFSPEIIEPEGRAVSLEFKDFTLWNIYFPNGKMSEQRLAYKLDFYDRIIHYFKETLPKQPNVILVGDLNTAHRPIDLARPKENEKISGFLPEERKKLDQLLALGFVDIYRTLYPDRTAYTWFSHFANARERNVGWRIDYQYVSVSLMNQVKDSIIQTQVTGSDHCPIELIL